MQPETNIEEQVSFLTRLCDNQSQKIDNLEDVIFEMLSLFQKRDGSPEIEHILKTYLHNCNLFRKKEKNMYNT